MVFLDKDHLYKINKTLQNEKIVSFHVENNDLKTIR